MRESPDNAQDRQLLVPVEAGLVAVAEHLAPSVVSDVGARLRQPDVPGGKRATTVEDFRERAAFAFKGRQIIPLIPCWQTAAVLGCPAGRVEMIHGLRSRQKPDGFIITAVLFGPCAAVCLAFMFSSALYSADFRGGF